MSLMVLPLEETMAFTDIMIQTIWSKANAVAE